MIVFQQLPSLKFEVIYADEEGHMQRRADLASVGLMITMMMVQVSDDCWSAHTRTWNQGWVSMGLMDSVFTEFLVISLATMIHCILFEYFSSHICFLIGLELVRRVLDQSDWIVMKRTVKVHRKMKI